MNEEAHSQSSALEHLANPKQQLTQEANSIKVVGRALTSEEEARLAQLNNAIKKLTRLFRYCK